MSRLQVKIAAGVVGVVFFAVAIVLPSVLLADAQHEHQRRSR